MFSFIRQVVSEYEVDFRASSRRYMNRMEWDV